MLSEFLQENFCFKISGRNMSNSDASGSSGDELKKNLMEYGSEVIEPCDSTDELRGDLDVSNKRAARRSFGEEVVGRNVKVWWPLDQMFYKGKIDYFDRVKRKHRVQYDDGDVELLDLAKERWQILGNDNLSTEQEQQEIGAAHASTAMFNDRGRNLSYLPKRKKEQLDIVVTPSASTGTLNDHGGKSSRLQKRKNEQQEIVAARTATKTSSDRREKSSRLLKRKKIKGAVKNEDKKAKTEARSSKGNLESAEDNSKKSN